MIVAAGEGKESHDDKYRRRDGRKASNVATEEKREVSHD